MRTRQPKTDEPREVVQAIETPTMSDESIRLRDEATEAHRNGLTEPLLGDVHEADTPPNEPDPRIAELEAMLAEKERELAEGAKLTEAFSKALECVIGSETDKSIDPDQYALSWRRKLKAVEKVCDAVQFVSMAEREWVISFACQLMGIRFPKTDTDPTP